MSTKVKPVEVASKAVKLVLTPTDHHQFRIAAATENSNMATVAVRLIKVYLARQSERRPTN
jgi:hypothetical protein